MPLLSCCWKTPPKSGVEGRCSSTFKLFCMGPPKGLNTGFYCSSQMWKAGRIASSKHFSCILPCSSHQSLTCWRQCSTSPSWSPTPASEWSDDWKSQLEDRGKSHKAKGYLIQDMWQACVLTLPPLGISISWTPLEPGVVLILVLFYTFSVCLFFSLSSKSLFLELCVR